MGAVRRRLEFTLAARTKTLRFHKFANALLPRPNAARLKFAPDAWPAIGALHRAEDRLDVNQQRHIAELGLPLQTGLAVRPAPLSGFDPMQKRGTACWQCLPRRNLCCISGSRISRETKALRKPRDFLSSSSLMFGLKIDSAHPDPCVAKAIRASVTRGRASNARDDQDASQAWCRRRQGGVSGAPVQRARSSLCSMARDLEVAAEFGVAREQIACIAGTATP